MLAALANILHDEKKKKGPTPDDFNPYAFEKKKKNIPKADISVLKYFVKDKKE